MVLRNSRKDLTMKNVILRHSAPTILDEVPFGTQCHVPHGKDFINIYLQMSSDDSEPRWEFLGTFSIDLNQQAIQEFINHRLTH